MKHIPVEAREELGAAQFILKADYTDWIWQQRDRLSIPPPASSKAWPFRRNAEIINLASRKKHK